MHLVAAFYAKKGSRRRFGNNYTEKWGKSKLYVFAKFREYCLLQRQNTPKAAKN
jgi:hypothetical protein